MLLPRVLAVPVHTHVPQGARGAREEAGQDSGLTHNHLQLPVRGRGLGLVVEVEVGLGLLVQGCDLGLGLPVKGRGLVLGLGLGLGLMDSHTGDPCTDRIPKLTQWQTEY